MVRFAFLRRVAAASAVLFGFVSSSALAVPSFPGAEGFGANALGGRGGTVYRVTNLNDTGAGSFREAVSQPNRTVIFEVGGIIRITSVVAVRENITIAGQTAPGGGVTIYGHRVSFSNAHNTICRYVRFREGINGESGTDAVGIALGHDMIFDHVSASWGRDETFSISGPVQNVTLQDCIIGQGLMNHSAGGLMQTDGGVSIFRSLYIDNWMRNPKVKGVNDFRNNVLYNWGGGGGYIPAGDSAGFSYTNLIGNYFIAGPDSPSSPFSTGNDKYSIYVADNLEDMNRNSVLDGVEPALSRFSTLNVVGAPFNYAGPVVPLTATQAVAHVLAYAGASLHRDAADTYMLGELASYGTEGELIFNENEASGIGTLPAGLAAADTDLDGMPDWWEQAAGTNPTTPDNNGDLNGDGYTNLENYINALAPSGVPLVKITGITTDTGASDSDGITSDNMLVLHGTALPNSTVTISRVDGGVIGTTPSGGDGSWVFDYDSVILGDRYYAFVATVDVGGTPSLPSVAFTVKVDTAAAAAPSITGLVTSPAFAFNGTAEPNAQVTITLEGVGVVGTVTADGLGNWSTLYTGAALAPGVYTFTAAALDVAGNLGASSVPYIVDTSLASPVFTSISDDTGTSNSDRITRDTILALNGTAPAGASVILTRVGVGEIGSITASAGGTWTFPYAPTLASGQYTFTAVASAGGSASPVSTPFVVTVDTVAPTIPSIVRRDPSTPSTILSTLVFRVNFSEPVVNVDAGDFMLTTAGAGMTGTISTCVAINSSTYDVTVINAGGDGTIRLDRRTNSSIQDFAGNAGSSGTFTGGQSYTMRLAGSGVWTYTDGGGLWSDSSNWYAGIVANGLGATADFSGLDLSEDTIAHLDSSRTIGRLVFGDIDQSSPASWTLSDNGNDANQLTMASLGTPNIQVIYTTSTGEANPVIAENGAAYPTILDVTLNSSTGLTKTGWGTAILTKLGTFSGPINVNEGRLKLGPGINLTATANPSVALAVSSQFEVAGANFTAQNDITMVSGTGVGVVVSAGVGNFKKIVPTNSRNNLVKVTGGTMTATDISFPRSGDAPNMFGFGLVIQGGNSTIGTVGLGTVNSWGAMSVEGGTVEVTGPLWVGWQQSAARGGQLRVLGGNLISSDPVSGIVLSRKYTAATPNNANNVGQFDLLGGTTTAEKILFGYDATVDAGTATLTLAGGQLYLGSGGLVKNGTGAFAATVTLTNGVVGAKSSWSSSMPLSLTAANTVAFKAADAGGASRDITLSGVLSGAGGFSKTGAGKLTLSGASTFSGDVNVSAGALSVSGSLAAVGTVTVGNGAILSGTGTIAKTVTLESGGTIAPGEPGAGTLTVSSLNWNGGGNIAFDLGAASDQLVIAGALSKTGTGAYAFAFAPVGTLSLGSSYTLATFASTNFTAADFSYTGLTGREGTFVVEGGALKFIITGDGSGVAAYDTWISGYGLPPAQATPEADPDGDGSSNLLEHMLLLDPTRPGTNGVAAGKIAVDGHEYPMITFVRRNNVTDIRLEVKASSGLEFAESFGTVLVSSTPLDGERDEVVVRSTVPLDQQPRQFFKLFVTLPLY